MYSYICPRCLTQKIEKNNYCTMCKGKYVYVDKLKEIVDSAEIHFIKKFSATSFSGNLHCSECQNLMKKIYVGKTRTELDICTGCNLVWFDTNEWELIKNTKWEPPDPDVNLLDYGRLIHKIHIDIEEAGHIGNAEIVSSDSIPLKKKIMSLLGFLVIEKDYKLKTEPVVTTTLIMACIIISSLSWINIEKAANYLAIGLFVPPLTIPIRIITYFFIHENWLHLFANMYCLWFFGSYVEDQIGSIKYLNLIFLSSIAGAISHIYLLQNTGLLIGASGGVFGIITYYIWRFPRQRFIRFTQFGWTLIPSLFVGAWILFLQTISLLSSTYGRPHGIAYAAHIAGGFIGFVLAFLWNPKSD